jgi:hemin uptake protein HemP
MSTHKPIDDRTPAPVVPMAQQRRVSSAELLGDQRELRIEHQGEQYTLRLTRLGKLILTK